MSWENIDWTVLAVTAMCLTIALLATRDAVYLYSRTRVASRIAKEYGNGRSIIADARHNIARWFLLGFISIICLLVLGFYAAISGDSLTSWIRGIFVFSLFCFWRAKHGNLVAEKRLDNLADLTTRMKALRELEQEPNDESKGVERRDGDA